MLAATMLIPYYHSEKDYSLDVRRGGRRGSPGPRDAGKTDIAEG